MSKSRDIADSAATINYIDTVTSNVQTQLNTATAAIAANTSAISNISVTNGSLTKTFANGEAASISLTSNVLVPNVSVIKEVPQTGVTNNSWDVSSTTENYTRLDSAAATTLNWVGDSISGATYASQSFNALSVLGGNVCDVAFKPDGLKMFLCAGTGIIYEYALSIAFDVSSASYSNTSGNISAQTPALTGISFSASGAKMYAIGTTNRTIYEFDLSTPWSVVSGSLSYSGNSFSIASQDTGPTGVTLNSSGTKAYVIGYSADSVYEFALSTAFDISSASFTSSFSVASQETSPQGLQFNSDGTLMFICGGNSSKIHAYNLSSAYDISSSVYNSAFLSTASQVAVPMGFAFDPTGSKLAVFGNNSIVYGYTLPLALSLGTGSFASADVGKTIEANSGAFVLTATNGSYVQTTAPTSYAQVASGSWEMYGVVYNTVDGDLELSNYADIYNLASASYDSKTLSTSSQDGVPLDMAFNTDGTKVYMSGAITDRVYQYILATAWDVSTGTTAGSFSFVSQDGNGRGIAFNNDGTKLYIAGGNADSIFQYSMSTAFDITTASYDSISLSISSQETEVMAIAFGNDGSKFYLIGTTNNSVFEYSLTTPYAINTATYTGTSFSVNSQESYPSGLAFSDDGTKMFVCGYLNNKVYLYNLTTAWDLSTASYSSVDFSVASQQSTPQGMALGNGGAKMYIVGESPSGIFQYSIGAGVTAATGYQPVHTTASIDTTYWTDINSMTADQAAGSGNVYYAISTDDRTTWTVIDNTDGERDIVRNNAGTWQYNSNATYASETWVNGATNTELATIAESMEGAVGSNGFQLASASYLNINFSVASQENVPQGFAFNTTGTKLFVVGTQNSEVFQYTLSTAFDVSSASYDSVNKNVYPQEPAPQDIRFNNDGTKMYIIGNQSIFEYSLSTAFLVSSASYTDSFSLTGQTTSGRSLEFNSDGTKMFMLNGYSRTYEYNLSSAFDISTASIVDNFYSIAQTAETNGLAFSSDGKKMFIADEQLNKVFQYNLSTGFDVSTAAYSSISFDVNSQETIANAIGFSANGTKMFIMGENSDSIFQYSSGSLVYTNQMDKTQLDAVTDPNHIALSNDFDLSIILNMTSGTTVPSSNGVAINYDANILNKGAVLGTDYDFDAPAQNKVRITALAANNLKVRVV